MRLSKENIKFVKVHMYYGVAYEFSVAMKSNRVSDLRTFGCFENLYKYEKLPATVRQFIENSIDITRNDNGDGFVVVTFR